MKTRYFILLLFVFSCAYAQGQTDTLPSNYLGDPTDPNCPCYNVQLRAEKEYQQLQMQQRKAKEDSMLALHHKSKAEMRKRMKQNEKRKKNKDCPQTNYIHPFLKYTLNVVPLSGSLSTSIFPPKA